MISQEEVKYIAKLARLGLAPQETKKFQKELSAILDYIEKLKELDVSQVEPTSHSLIVENVMRKDEQKEAGQTGLKSIVLVPERKKGFVKVKPIF